jgi:large subunit ribosomal protein L35Ae
MNYRTGIRAQMSLECLIQFTNADSEKFSGNLIGQKVQWTNGKSMLIGKIVGFHGKNGVVRARFKKGVPGQAIGSTVQLISKPLAVK